MRLLVVFSSEPNSSFCREPDRSSAPQPPIPGLPRHAPSVYSSTEERRRFSGNLGNLATVRHSQSQALSSLGEVPVLLAAEAPVIFSGHAERVFVSSVQQSDRRLTRSATNGDQHVPVHLTSAAGVLSLLAGDKRKSYPP